MFVIKRNVVLVRCDGGAAGFVRLECLRGKTEGEVKMRCPEGSLLEMMADGKYFSAPANAPFDLPFALREDSRVAARIVKDGGVIALSSAAGREFAARASAGEKKGEEGRGQAREEKKSAPEKESAEEEKEKEQRGKKSAPEKERVEKKREQESGLFEKEESKQPPQEAKEEEREKSEGREGKTRFLGAISASLEELFSLYPAEERLAGVVPFSKWVRVPLESGYYVVGVISDQEGAARYLAYGVPDKDNAFPPDAYPACRGWLPLEEDGAGYWMMYQDALTGEIVKK